MIVSIRKSCLIIFYILLWRLKWKFIIHIWVWGDINHNILLYSEVLCNLFSRRNFVMITHSRERRAWNWQGYIRIWREINIQKRFHLTNFFESAMITFKRKIVGSKKSENWKSFLKSQFALPDQNTHVFDSVPHPSHINYFISSKCIQ